MKKAFLLKKSILYLFFLFFAFSFVATACPSNAQGINDSFNASDDDDILGNVAKGGGYEVEEDSGNKFNEIIATIINIVLSLLGIIFLALMIYGGFLWMTARGNETQVTKARDLITAAIIGLIIVLGAYAITYFVISRIGAGTLTA